MTFLHCTTIQNVPFTRPLSVLLDSGSTTSWFNHRALPSNINPAAVPALHGTTMAGNFQSNQQLSLSTVSLPELSDLTLPNLKARMFNAKCRYDLILGCDILSHFGIDIDFKSQSISGPTGHSIHLRQFPTSTALAHTDIGVYLSIDHFSNLLSDTLTSSNDDAPLASDIQEPLSSPEPPCLPEPHTTHPDPNPLPLSKKHKTSILPSLYEKHDPQTIAKRCIHLDNDQQCLLADLLAKFTTLFNGELKVYPHQKLHLEVDPSVRPFVSRAYPIPKSQLQIFKAELHRLAKIGILECQGRSIWAAGTFIIPKKDGRVCWISDFHALNKAIICHNYPIPRIQDILLRRSGYKFLTKLDLSMQYYTFELDEESRDLCTIATPFGPFRYTRLPMGISTSPDMAQEIMEQVLCDLNDTEVYLDDIAAFSTGFTSHLVLLEKILSCLQDNGFAVNPLKCEWAIQETDFLGHWLTPTGIKPYHKKVNASVHMEAPKNLKQLRSFLGMVSDY